jgi:hypothetical protein
LHKEVLQQKPVEDLSLSDEFRASQLHNPHSSAWMKNVVQQERKKYKQLSAEAVRQTKRHKQMESNSRDSSPSRVNPRPPVVAVVKVNQAGLFSKAGLSLAASSDASRKGGFGMDVSDEQDDGFDDGMDGGKRKKRLPGVRVCLSVVDAHSPEICGIVHRLAPNVDYDKYAGRFVWVRLGESVLWLPAQIVLLRDVPLEYLSQVLSLKESVEVGVNAVLVAFFTVPYRSFAWVFPQKGEVAEFNQDWVEYYLDFAASVDSKELLTALTFAQRVLMYDTPESVQTETDWVSLDEMRALPYDLGRLVWARPTPTGVWFPATISSESEVPASILGSVMSSCNNCNGQAVLVVYFDHPENLFGWVPLSAFTLQPFRCLAPHLLRAAVAKTPRLAKTEEWLLCVRRALLFESLCVPSKSEEPRWSCRGGCMMANVPGRTACLICRLPRSSEGPLSFVVPNCVVLGLRLLENTSVRFWGLEMDFTGSGFPTLSKTLLYRSVTLIVFALASPVPFVALYTKDLAIKPRQVYSWVLLALPAERPAVPGQLSLWGLVFQVVFFFFFSSSCEIDCFDLFILAVASIHSKS